MRSLGVWATSLVVCALLLAAHPALAADERATVWTTRGDFEAGTLESLDAVTEPGTLRLQPIGDAWVRDPTRQVVFGNSNGTWDSYITSFSILFEPPVYKMWYAGCEYSSCDIGYATSLDGSSWDRYSGNPVVRRGITWDLSLSYPYVLKSGASYRMWFEGFALAGGTSRIGYATSADGVNWTKHPDPVLQPDPGIWWDSYGATAPVVIEDAGSFVMLYAGSFDTSRRIGRAVSSDGILWSRSPASDPVLSYQEWWEGSTLVPVAVSPVSGSYELLYLAENGRLAQAWSSDTIVWGRAASNPLYSDFGFVSDVALNGSGQGRGMYFARNDFSAGWEVGLASSTTAFSSEGRFTSALVDSGEDGSFWTRVDWTASLPDQTGVEVTVRAGDTPDPGRWTRPGVLATGPPPADVERVRGRFGRVEVRLLASDPVLTPRLESVELTAVLTHALHPVVLGLVFAASGAASGLAIGFLVERVRLSRRTVRP